ncbi:MAG: IS1249 family transposase [Eggerthellaceae bacterium]|nr:IS1249 family transposase [Eggerthellaceae bacterium]
MKKMKCPACGGDTKRNGRTSSGRTRWRCKACGASTTQSYDTTPQDLSLFLDWLLGKRSQSEMGMPARTFRARTSRFWSIWPVLPVCDEIHHVVYADGIWLGRSAVLLIARTDDHVIGCHLARSENSLDWGFLMRRIAPPDVLVCDGMGGIEKARRAWWPDTRVQRCVFHAFCQVKRCTTSRPKLQAGAELYGIARDLLAVSEANGAAEWLASFSSWCARWERFLGERTIVDGRPQYKHERLRKARRGLERLCRAGTLFTFLDEGLAAGGAISPTSNAIESGNARIREVLRSHRGLALDRRVKAGFWWCYMHSEAPLPPRRMLEELPTDEQIMEWRRLAASPAGESARWGAAVLWPEFHMCGSKGTGWF